MNNTCNLSNEQLFKAFMEDHIRQDVWNWIENCKPGKCADAVKKFIEGKDADEGFDYIANEVADRYLSGEKLPANCSYYVMLEKLIIECCQKYEKTKEEPVKEPIQNEEPMEEYVPDEEIIKHIKALPSSIFDCYDKPVIPPKYVLESYFDWTVDPSIDWVTITYATQKDIDRDRTLIQNQKMHFVKYEVREGEKISDDGPADIEYRLDCFDALDDAIRNAPITPTLIQFDSRFSDKERNIIVKTVNKELANPRFANIKESLGRPFTKDDIVYANKYSTWIKSVENLPLYRYAGVDEELTMLSKIAGDLTQEEKKQLAKSLSSISSFCDCFNHLYTQKTNDTCYLGELKNWYTCNPVRKQYILEALDIDPKTLSDIEQTEEEEIEMD